MFLQEKIVRSVLNLVPNGQLFTVRFQKRDGKERTMVCQKGVSKHVTGTGTAERPDHIQCVYTPEGYRSFNVSRVFEIRALGAKVTSN